MNYSQNNEQNIILNYFKNYKGTLLDLGANDGITFSNSYAALRSGWKGLLVEASPNVFIDLEKLYRNNDNVQLLNVAVGMFNENITFYESGTLLNKGDISLVSTIDEAELKRWGKTKFTPKEVKCYDFKSLMELSEYKTFDLISIDIEGMDYKVLTQMNLTDLQCKMLIVEYNGKNEKDYVEYAGKFGMKLHSKNLENLIFLK
jgi:FkbM family methyltransferase